MKARLWLDNFSPMTAVCASCGRTVVFASVDQPGLTGVKRSTIVASMVAGDHQIVDQSQEEILDLEPHRCAAQHLSFLRKEAGDADRSGL